MRQSKRSRIKALEAEVWIADIAEGHRNAVIVSLRRQLAHERQQHDNAQREVERLRRARKQDRADVLGRVRNLWVDIMASNVRAPRLDVEGLGRVKCLAEHDVAAMTRAVNDKS